MTPPSRWFTAMDSIFREKRSVCILTCTLRLFFLGNFLSGGLLITISGSTVGYLSGTPSTLVPQPP